MSAAELPTSWRHRAELFRRHGAEPQACTCEALAAELEAALYAERLEAVPLDAAERASGYTRGHLRRELREGKIPNAGTEAEPMILRAHLPRKPGHAVAIALCEATNSRLQVARAVIDGG